MIPVVDEKRVDVRADGVQEVVADPALLSFVEKKAVSEILFGSVENLDFHDARFLRSFFTSLQSS